MTNTEEIDPMKTFLVAAATLLAVSGGAATAADLRFGIKTETPSLDPHWSTNVTAMDIDHHIFGYLLAPDSEFQMKPDLATSWRMIDNTTWEFKLRENVKFSDGSPFTADDVLFSMERVRKIKSAAGFQQYVADKHATKIDDYTVQVTTDKPNPLTYIQMSSIAIVSRKSSSGPEDQAAYNTGKATIGTGPFKLVEWIQGDRLVLEKNPNYWGPAPQWDHVTFKPIASDPVRMAALLSGDVDAIDRVTPTDASQYAKDPRIVINAGPGSRPFYVWLDSRRDISPFVKDAAGQPIFPNPLRDWRVRKALSKAINRAAIVQRVFNGYATPTIQLTPDHFYGWNEKLTVEPYDPEGAKKLLAEAGYPQGFQTSLQSTTGHYTNDVKVAEAIAQMWTQIGVKTTVETMPDQVFFSRAASPGFANSSVAIRTYSVVGGEPSVQVNAIIHTNNWPDTIYCCQWTGYSNPRTDELSEKAAVTMDPVEREKVWKEVAGIAVNDVGYIGLYVDQNIWGTRAGLKYINRLDAYNYAVNVVQ